MPPKSSPAAKKPTASSTAVKPVSKPAAKTTAKTGAKTGTKPATKGTAPAKTTPAAAPPPPPPQPIVYKEISIKELNTVVNDTDGLVKASGKWAIIVDENSIPARFLRHRDVNMLSVPSEEEMQPESIRKALIGSIKYGKPLVIDMMESEMYEFLKDQFDKILPGLLDMVLDKSIVDDTYRYMKIVKEEDGRDFSNQYDYKLLNFSLIILSACAPNEELLRKTLPFKIAS